MELDDALSAFEGVEANLKRLEAVWDELQKLAPRDVSFAGDPGRYEQLMRAFEAISSGLPPIDGWRITARPWGVSEIIQARIDAHDVGEASAFFGVQDGISAPGTEIADYRFRAARKRMHVVRQKVRELVSVVDGLLQTLPPTVERDNASIAGTPGWQELTASISQIERLVAGTVARTGRWGDMHRHIAFAQGCDLHDIAEFDWPTVRRDIEGALYDLHEPVPVDVEDLGLLVAPQASGPISTALAWDSISADDFERLLLNLIQDAPGYENPRRLTQTNAPDRGRDLSVERVVADSLAGTSRRRVIIQCKHWRSRSVRVPDLADAVAQMTLWEPPRVDVLVLATSGRFTSDAIAWAEARDVSREVPAVELWPESLLESMLAERPDLIAAFSLRGSTA